MKKLKNYLSKHKWKVCLVLILLSPVVIYYSIIWYNRSVYASKLNSLRQKGIYKDIDTIRDEYRREHPERVSLDQFDPDTESGCCDSSEEETDVYDIREQYVKEKYLRNRRKRNEAVKSIKSFLEKHMNEIKDLMDKKEFLPADVKLSLDATLPHLLVRQRQAAILQIYGQLKLYQGKEQQALDVSNTIQNMSLAMMNEPLVVSVLVGLLMYERALSLREDLIYLTETRSILGKIQKLQLDRPFVYRSLRESMKTYLSTIVSRIEQHIQTGEKITIPNEKLPELPALSYIYTRPFLWRSAKKYLSLYETVFEHVDNPEAVDDLHPVHSSPINAIIGYEYYGQIISYYPSLVSYHGSVPEDVAKRIARHELVAIGARIKRHILDHGSVSDQTLSDYLSKPDPFSQQSYRHRRTAQDIIIYSVGTNYKDDNGTPGEYDGDIIVKIPTEGR